MKTPKRKFGLDKKWTCYQQTRWKRKNRVKQLKRTIARLKKEKEEAYHKGHKAGYDLGFSRLMF